MELITDTFVLVAPDCPVTAAVVPAARGSNPTVPVVQYELLAARPYQFTLEELIFETHVRRAGLSGAEAADKMDEIRADLLAGGPEDRPTTAGPRPLITSGRSPTGDNLFPRPPDAMPS